jgi:formylglycine-generating enzyme required for sulfatase activity
MKFTLPAGFMILFILSVSAGAQDEEKPAMGSAHQKANSQAKAETEIWKRDKDRIALEERIRGLSKEERYQEATTQWEKAFGLDPHLRDKLDRLRWLLAQAYVKQHQYDKAINIFKPHDFDTFSIEQRAELGEILLFGETGLYPVGEGYLIGRAQCALCHAFSKDAGMTRNPSPPWGPHFFAFTGRIKRLIASPQYQQRSKKTEQPEAFPGSGIATSVIEYLAESNVCPSCYITPGFGIRGSQDHESPMPKIHSAPISLSIDEMIAIDTYLLKKEQEEIPPLSAMRAAYEKFLRPADQAGAYERMQLASLYDVKGDTAEAIRLLDASYTVVEPMMMNMSERQLASFLQDVRFPNLEQQPEVVAKFPLLFQMSRKVVPGQAYSKEIIGKDGAPMAFVPAGEFLYGEHNDPMSLPAFYMDKYEVTVIRYASFLETSRRMTPKYWDQASQFSEGDRPVMGVDWYDADAYCRQYGKRLPTEQEWEKAARGTDGREYPWGNTDPTSRQANFGKTHWYHDGINFYREVLTAVGSYEHGKSLYGIYDLAGNVWEWTSTFPDSHQKVCRGGSWLNEESSLRSVNRERLDPSERHLSLGFRCAQDGK